MRLIIVLCFLSLSLHAQTTLEKADAFVKAKKYEDAKKLLTPIKEGDKDYAAARYYLGRIAFGQEKLDDAIDFFEEAIETNDKVADYHYWYGNALGSAIQDANMFKQGIMAPKIRAAFEKTIELDPTNLGAYQGLISYYAQAPAIVGGGMDKAYATADKMKKINLAAGCRAKANLLVKDKKNDAAEKEWKAAVAADASSFSGLIQFYTNQKKFNAAFTALDEALKKTPEDMLLIYQFGRTSAISGERLPQGEAYLKKYLTYKPKENEPSHAGANMRLGQIMEKKGNKPEAKKFFQTAVQLDPNLKEAKEGLERVK
jgi:tetratricopeptide (TPR) repeat protein